MPPLPIVRHFPGERPAGPAGDRLVPGLLVDRDGVLNRRIVGGYVLDPSELEILDAVLPALRAASGAGVPVVVVSNQGAVGRGLLAETTLRDVHELLFHRLRDEGVQVAGVYACPHHPAATRVEDRACRCRKPEPGLLLAAAADLGLDLGRSMMIGDQASDRDAALAAGVPAGHTRLVDAAAMTRSDTAALAGEVAEVLDLAAGPVSRGPGC